MDSSTPSSSPLSRRPLRARLIQEEEDDKGEDSNNIDSPSHISTPPSKSQSKSRSKSKATPSIRPPPHSPTPAVVSSLQDLLLLSPPPYQKPRPRPVLLVDEAAVAVDASSQSSATPRRRGVKSRAAGGSPRNVRRARRRLEKEIVVREMVHFPFEDDGGRVRISKTKQQQTSSRPPPNKVSNEYNQEDEDDQKLCLVASASALPPTPILQTETAAADDGGSSKWELQIRELVMWKNVAKSTLWFGLGSVFFISSCFSRDFNFSLISAASHLGILILGLAFFYDSVPQRQLHKPRGANFQLTEEDLLRTARLILPMANAGLAKAQEVFSGEPSMTLKVAPILIFTAKYGHLITPWRLLVTGFFLSFTIPKLYSCYSERLHNRVHETTNYVWEAWKSCPRKNFVAASIAMMLWNIFTVKTRIFAAFISVVVLRYHHQHQIGGKGEANIGTSNKKP